MKNSGTEYEALAFLSGFLTIPFLYAWSMIPQQIYDHECSVKSGVIALILITVLAATPTIVYIIAKIIDND